MKKMILNTKMAMAAVLMLLGLGGMKAQLSATITNNTGVSCFGSCDGSLTVSASGGAGGYTFNWAPGGLTTATISGLCAGTFTVTVTDQMANVTTATATVNQPTQLSASVSGVSSVCQGSNFSPCVNAIGGSPAYTFVWTGPNGFTSTLACPVINNVSSFNAGAYVCTVTDANACVASATVTLVVNSVPNASITNLIEPSCTGSNGSATGIGSGGNPPYTYLWYNGAVTQVVTGLPTGAGNLIIIDANGCYSPQFNFMVLDSCEVVWPGDADNDLTANSNDILDIGLYYGNSTNARPAQGNGWFGYPSENAALTKPNGYNVKHDDCNGDGTVDASDTSAVILNYNLVHPPYKLAQTIMAGPPLQLEFVPDSIGNSDVAYLNVNLGTAANPVNNVYGLALTISIDTSMVAKDSSHLSAGSSWLGTGSPVFLNNRIENYNNAEIDLVFCRTDHNNVSGYGTVGTLEMIMKDDISGKFASFYEKTMYSMIVRYKLIDVNGDTISVTPVGDSVEVSMLSTELNQQSTTTFSAGVYPNPVHDQLKVVAQEAELKKVEIYNYAGQLSMLVEPSGSSKELNINTSQLESGVYIVKVYGNSGIKVLRIQKH